MKILKKEMIGLFLMVLGLLISLSIIGYDYTEQPGGFTNPPESWLGHFGVFVGYPCHMALGYLSLILPLTLLIAGYTFFSSKSFKEYYKFLTYCFSLCIWLSIFFSILKIEYLSGIYDDANQTGLTNLIGYNLSVFLVDIFGYLGRVLIMTLLAMYFVILVFKVSIYEKISFFKDLISKKIQIIFNKIKNFFKGVKEKFLKIKNKYSSQTDYDDSNEKNSENIIQTNSLEITKNEKISLDESQEVQILNNELDLDQINDLDDNNIDEDIKAEEKNIEEKSDHNNDHLVIDEEMYIEEGDLDEKINEENKYLNYKLPELKFLDEPLDIITHNEDILKEKGEQLSYALNSFGVSGKIVRISPGPVITLFEIEPAEGVRVNKFTNLSEDLSRIMGGKRVRIIAPIPGSRSVGIELPNDSPSIVYLKSILNSKKYVENKSKLKIALGKTTTGDAFFFELNKMPHLLVAGATGAGKSVCINTIIISILYNAKPDEVKFILMDPKKVELTTYKSLVGYHLITAKNLDEYVMTTSENSVSILNSAINEMERRFQVFSDVRVRNLDEYNTKRNRDSSLENIPHVIVIIDELADLMMTSGRAIEEPITRLAQKARAVGMHLIVATQRPSVDVITGLIKSNFPARISFQVSSKIDSRTIIDQMGAEKLLGRGDMLFLLPGSASPIRVHNAYVTLDEIEQIMNHISSQPKPDEVKLPEIKKMESSNEFDISDNQDELLKDAAVLVVDVQQASVSLLQRKFRIGYSRAGRIVDELESLGIVSGYSGSKAREVLVDHTYINEIFGD
ncbi:MAG: cell division protein FtsK [Candidatus Marinimicrobia bacterium]|nr:cell division protein FtsK [Candidatus Neomarinimicrobiota bacterium]